LLEHECPRCHREVELPFGELCRPCRAELERRTSRIARRVALISTALLALYIFIRIPRERTATLVAAAAAAAWYLLSYQVARKIAREIVK
jgi:hypothetical protein